MSLCPIRATPGTASLWQWRNPPKRSSGTRRSACPPSFPSSTYTSHYKAHLDSFLALAFCSPAPGSGSPLGWTFLQQVKHSKVGHGCDVLNAHFIMKGLWDGLECCCLFFFNFTRVRDASICHYFCEEDPKRPHIWFYGEGTIVDSLWGGPLDGELCTYEQRRHYFSKRICQHLVELLHSVKILRIVSNSLNATKKVHTHIRTKSKLWAGVELGNSCKVHLKKREKMLSHHQGSSADHLPAERM